MAIAIGATWLWLKERPLARPSFSRDESMQADLILAAPTRPHEIYSQADTSDAGPAPATDAEMIDAQRNAFVLHFADKPSQRNAAQERAGPTNLLLVGLDQSAHPLGGRTDAIVLVRIAPPSVAIISVPRDLLVQVEGHPPKRINAIARLARLHRQDPKRVLREVVEELLDLQIEHTVFIELEALESAIDRLGGIVVDVPCPIDDNFIVNRSPLTYEAMRVDAGLQPMSGRIAALYMRSRHGRSDWDRQLRQHDVLRALHEAVREQPVWSVVQAAMGAREHIDTEMTHAQMLWIGQQIATIDPAEVHFVRFSREMAAGARLEDGRSVLQPNEDLIRERVEDALSAEKKDDPVRRRCKDRAVALQPHK